MSTSPYLSVIASHSGWRSVLRLQGEVDLYTRDRLRHAISCAIKRRPRLLVVDLSALSFMDCSGLAVLVWAHQTLADQGHRLLITGAQPIVLRLVHLTGLGAYLHLSTSESRQADQQQGAPAGPLLLRLPTREPVCNRETAPAGGLADGEEDR